MKQLHCVAAYDVADIQHHRRQLLTYLPVIYAGIPASRLSSQAIVRARDVLRKAAIGGQDGLGLAFYCMHR